MKHLRMITLPARAQGGSGGGLGFLDVLETFLGFFMTSSGIQFVIESLTFKYQDVGTRV
jgi:hypothetical protein